MKRYSLIVFLVTALVFLAACSSEKPKLQLHDPAAFAYLLDNGWELNASVQVKGFTQNENDGRYIAKLSYTVNIITAKGDTLEDVDSGIADKNDKEQIGDMQINSQIELDSSYATGSYKLIFIVNDDLTENNTARIEQKFELSKE